MDSPPYITRQTSLSANIVQFCRFLRTKGIPNGPREEADALRAMESLTLTDPDLMRLSLRAILTRKRADQIRFDELYQQYWRELERAVDAKTKDQPKEKNKPTNEGQPKKEQLQALKSWLNLEQEQNEEEELSTYSAAENWVMKDFSGFQGEDLQEVMQLIHLFARTLATQYQRRYQKAKRSSKMDLRRTMRQNLRRGGEIVELAYQKRRIRRLKMVVLCDVSKSMDLYSRFLVQFIYAFQNVYRRIETFVFGTQLHRISEQLREREFASALENLSDKVHDWSGGTRIGYSLQAFCEQYGERMLDDDTLVLILSDGWDTGEPAVLENAMRFIHRKAHKVIWLNPLAGNPDFEPTVLGLEVAMPYIDLFASAHNLDSLRRAIRQLPAVR